MRCVIGSMSSVSATLDTRPRYIRLIPICVRLLTRINYQVIVVLLLQIINCGIIATNYLVVLLYKLSTIVVLLLLIIK